MKRTILVIALLLAPSISWGAAGQGFSTWAALAGAIADGDLFGITDVSDTSGSDNGTSKKVAASAVKSYILPDTLVGDCTVGPCLDGTSDGGNLIKLWAGTGSYWTALQGGAPSANRSWRLPIDAPPSAGTTRLMNIDEYGQMGFVDPATFATPTGSAASMTVVATGFDGNLATTDNTMQEIAQKLDDLNVSGSMTWPTGAAGTIPVYGGSSNWGTSYSLTTLAAALDGEPFTFTGAVDMSGASSFTTGNICFEGSTVDANDTCFSVINPTGSNSVELGDFDMQVPIATAVGSDGYILISGITDSTTQPLGLGEINLGHASDTTIARSGAGAITVEAKAVVLSGNTVAIDHGGAASFEIPNGNDINVDAVGEVSYDTNGNWLRAYDGTNQIALAQKLVCHDGTVAKPNDLPDAHRDGVRLWQNNSGMNFVVTSWVAQSSADNTDLNIETTTNSGGTNATVDAVSITTDGTGFYYASDSTITAGTISNGSIIWLDFDDTDTPDWVSISVCGYFNGDVD